MPKSTPIFFTVAVIAIGAAAYLWSRDHPRQHAGDLPANSTTPVAHESETRSTDRASEQQQPPVVSVSTPSPTQESRPPSWKEERDRLLAAVNSRESALAYVDAWFAQGPIDQMKPNEVPRFKIVTESDLPEPDRPKWAAARAKAEAKDHRFVMTQLPGENGVHVFEIPEPQIERLLPARVVQYMAPEDIQNFRDRVVYWMVEAKTVKFYQQAQLTRP